MRQLSCGMNHIGLACPNSMDLSLCGISLTSFFGSNSIMWDEPVSVHTHSTVLYCGMSWDEHDLFSFYS
jgi:hypothetical protein